MRKGEKEGRRRERDRELGRGGGVSGRGRAYPTSFGRKSEPLTGAGHVIVVKSEPYKIHVKK